MLLFFAFIHQTAKANFSESLRVEDCREWFPWVSNENTAIFILISI